MKNNRTNKILEILSVQEKADVVSLAEICHVSQVTMRKDLDGLENLGLVKRMHGYAMINNTDDLRGRLSYHYEEKRQIAYEASKLVNDNDTIMIENGSCCALLASIIAKEKKNITIITNSAYIADFIREEDVNIILLGGIYQKDSQCVVGPTIETNASFFHVHYFFIGTDGYSSKTGFTNKDTMRAEAVKSMAKAADEIVVVSESEKFNHVGTVSMNLNNKITVVSDNKLTQEMKDTFIKDGIQVIQGEILCKS